jgi:hypothetical protein
MGRSNDSARFVPDGLVALPSFPAYAWPRADLTGVSSLSVEVSRKQLEFMHELLPAAASRFASMMWPYAPGRPCRSRRRVGLCSSITEHTREAAGRWLEKKSLHTGDPLFPSRPGEVDDRAPVCPSAGILAW